MQPSGIIRHTAASYSEISWRGPGVPLLAGFLGKFVLDILPAALASVIGGFLFTQYQAGHPAAPHRHRAGHSRFGGDDGHGARRARHDDGLSQVADGGGAEAATPPRMRPPRALRRMPKLPQIVRPIPRQRTPRAHRTRRSGSSPPSSRPHPIQENARRGGGGAERAARDRASRSACAIRTTLLRPATGLPATRIRFSPRRSTSRITWWPRRVTSSPRSAMCSLRSARASA